MANNGTEADQAAKRPGDGRRTWHSLVMTVPPATEEIILRVPARPPYGRIVRVGAAALAFRQGMTFGEIDDVRLAIDESMILLLDGATGDGVIDCVFRMTAGRFELEAMNTGEHSIDPTALSRFVEHAAELVDDYDVDPRRGWLRIRKDHTE
jgi:hypothetical protein